MKRLTILILTSIFLLTSFTIKAQNLTGIWRGSFFSPTDIAMGGSKYRYEVQIDNKGREAKGVTYSYQTTRFYGKASLVGVWSPTTKNFVLQEDNMLDLKITGGGDGCLMTCYLTYKKENGKEYLEGTYTSANMNNKNQNCGGGRVFLEKVEDTDFELEPFLLNKKEPSTSKGKVKPGQEDYLVNKPPTTAAAKPPVNKPPVVKTTPPPNNGGKTNTTAKPPTTAAKPPVAASKPPANTKPVTGTTPPEKASRPSTSTTKPSTSPTKPPVSGSKNPDITKVESGEMAKPNTEPVKPKPVQVAPPPPVLKERKNELFKTITTSERFVEISFYDNGEIDGDTISVYNNNRLVASKKGLSAKPVNIKIELSESDNQQDIIMVAENLGSIPPNTALMIVKAGGQRFTLNLSSTEQKNAMVRFKYQVD